MMMLLVATGNPPRSYATGAEKAFQSGPVVTEADMAALVEGRDGEPRPPVVAKSDGTSPARQAVS